MGSGKITLPYIAPRWHLGGWFPLLKNITLVFISERNLKKNVMAEAQCNGEGRREVSTDLSWMFGLSRKGSKKINMLLGHGYLRFSMSTFSLVSQLC